MLEIVVSEQDVLSLDPSNWRGKLISEQLDEDDVRTLLPVFRRIPLILLPLAKNLVEARRKGLVVDNLSILLCRLEGLGYEIRNVFANQSVEVEMSGVDLLG